MLICLKGLQSNRHKTCVYNSLAKVLNNKSSDKEQELSFFAYIYKCDIEFVYLKSESYSICMSFYSKGCSNLVLVKALYDIVS